MSLRSVCVKKSRSRVKNRVAHIASFKIRVYSRNSWTKKLTFPQPASKNLRNLHKICAMLNVASRNLR